ncbi:MAG: YjjG family noncanonical pyrimidine nucleotidase [Bacteroidales bacterium]
MNTYKHIFFDLDRTLWDFDTNNRETFREMYDHFGLLQRGIPDPVRFYDQYQQINMALWEDYKQGIIEKETLNFERFHQSLLLYSVNDSKLAKEMGEWYVRLSPLKTNLYPHTLQVLETLQRKYQLHIITNGFEEVQYIKLEKSGLKPFFSHIITSERAGFKKPDKRIFEYALHQTGASVHESLIIGDDPQADIAGGQQVGMDQIWVKHHAEGLPVEDATFCVEKLSDILDILGS